MRALFIFFTRYRLIRYLMSGGTGAVVHLGTVYVLTHLLHVWYLVATSLGFLVALGVSFVLQKYWTFQNTETNVVRRQGTIFAVVSTTNFFLNGLLMTVFVESFGLMPVVAQVFTSALIAAEAFVAYSFIFRSHTAQTAVSTRGSADEVARS